MFNILALFLGLVIMLFFGAADFVGAKASRKVGARRAAFWVLVTEGIVLIAFLLLFFTVPQVSPSYILLLLATGILGSAAFLSYYKGMEVGIVSIVVPIAASWPVVTVILSILFLNQQLNSFEIAGITFLILGSLLATSQFNKKDLKSSRFKKSLPYAIFSLFAWGLVFFILNIFILKFGGLFPTALLLSTYSVYYLVYSKATKQKILIPKSVIFYVVLVGLFEAIGITSYTVGVNSGFVAIMAPLVASSPAFTIILAWAFLKEKLKKLQYLGIAFVLIGLILIAIA